MCKKLVECVVSVSYKQDWPTPVPLVLDVQQVLNYLYAYVGFACAWRALDQG